MVVDIGGESYYSGKISKFITEAKEKGFDGVKFLNLDDAVGLADRPATHILSSTQQKSGQSSLHSKM